jgi:hypothetical protein
MIRVCDEVGGDGDPCRRPHRERSRCPSRPVPGSRLGRLCRTSSPTSSSPCPTRQAERRDVGRFEPAVLAAPPVRGERDLPGQRGDEVGEDDGPSRRQRHVRPRRPSRPREVGGMAGRRPDFEHQCAAAQVQPAHRDRRDRGVGHLHGVVIGIYEPRVAANGPNGYGSTRTAVMCQTGPKRRVCRRVGRDGGHPRAGQRRCRSSRPLWRQCHVPSRCPSRPP